MPLVQGIWCQEEARVGKLPVSPEWSVHATEADLPACSLERGKVTGIDVPGKLLERFQCGPAVTKPVKATVTEGLEGGHRARCDRRFPFRQQGLHNCDRREGHHTGDGSDHRRSQGEEKSIE